MRSLLIDLHRAGLMADTMVRGMGIVDTGMAVGVSMIGRGGVVDAGKGCVRWDIFYPGNSILSGHNVEVIPLKASHASTFECPLYS